MYERILILKMHEIDIKIEKYRTKIYISIIGMHKYSALVTS